MQKRSKQPAEALYQPIDFSDGLPVVLNPHTDSREPVNALHYHNALEVSLCTKGHGIFFIEEVVHPYGEGTVVKVAPNVLHIAHSEGRQSPQWLTLYIDLQFVGTALASASLPMQLALGSHVVDELHSRTLADDIARLAKEVRQADGLSRLGIPGWLNVVLAELARCGTSKGLHSNSHNHGFDRIAPALNLIATGLDRPLAVLALARACGMSASNFQRQFRNVMKQSPHQYLLNSRIQFTKTLLRDPSLSILEIAGRCGFETLSTFNRAFNSRTGMSPRQWRKRLTEA